MAGQTELSLLGEIAGEAAHELRNALAVIAASASLIRAPDAAARGVDVAGHVAKIERNTRIAQGVVDGLMALARGESVRAGVVALADAVGEARKDVPLDPKKGAPAWADELPADFSVRGNELLLSRMFRVLYENAVQAGASKIATRAARTGETVTVDVSDDGPGVPEAVRATLFEPLVTTKTDGTGLGLALARRVARAHGGDVELVPAAGGAHFRITLRA